MIEYCLDNVDDADRAALLDAGTDVREKPCLDLCGVCFEHAFLLVDGEEIVAGPDHRTVFDRLIDRDVV